MASTDSAIGFLSLRSLVGRDPSGAPLGRLHGAGLPHQIEDHHRHPHHTQQLRRHPVGHFSSQHPPTSAPTAITAAAGHSTCPVPTNHMVAARLTANANTCFSPFSRVNVSSNPNPNTTNTITLK